MKPATLHDVAQQAGVSLMTVSRALSRPQTVSPKTLQRVQEALAQTGYIPNLLAGGLKSRKSMTVVGLVPVISVQQFLPSIRALTDALNAAGYQFILGQTGYDHSREDMLIHSLLGRRPDALVITGQVHAPRTRALLRKLKVPVVEVWSLGPDPVDMQVGFSHEAVGALVGQFFARKGWTHVGVATATDERGLQRRAGFVNAMGRELPTSYVSPPSSLAAGRSALAELLRMDPALQAVYCSSDSMAHGVMIEAQVRGLRVPQDLAVCGFGDTDFAAHTHPGLTTVRVDGTRIGHETAQLILARCSGQDLVPRTIDVGIDIIERGST